MKTKAFILAGLVLCGAQSWAEKSGTIVERFPFQQSVIMNRMSEVASSNPKNLVSLIQSYGIDILVFKSPIKERKINPNFSNLQTVSLELVESSGIILEEDLGQLVRPNDPRALFKRPTILIADTAADYHLIHEFMHSQLISDVAPVHIDISPVFAKRYNKMYFYYGKITGNPESLLNPLWRRDISSALQDTVEVLNETLQSGPSQEAIIGKTLARLIGPGNPYFNQALNDHALKYGEYIIDSKMIDYYNRIDQIIRWCSNTVRGLKEGLDSGDLDLSGGSLTKKEAKKFQEDMQLLLAKLEPVKAEILKTKKFYTEP